MNFNKPIIVYLPCYNCEKNIVNTLLEIPESLHDKIECLVVDNASHDNTSKVLLEAINNDRFPFNVNLVRTKENLGYSGSQKLAYSLFVKSENAKHIIMLHGDGQYPPKFLKDFSSYTDSEYSVVNGFRSKKAFPEHEETPFVTYAFVKSLSLLESLGTGFWFKEWHSGYVMYSKNFLRRIPLNQLTTSMHIDGELLICAGELGHKVHSIPIHKKYKDLVAFAGLARIKYVFRVFKVIIQNRLGHHKRMLKISTDRDYKVSYTVLTQGL